MRSFIGIGLFCFVLTVVCVSMGAAQQPSPPANDAAVTQPVLSQTPGDFLTGEPPKGNSLPGFYNEIPTELEQAIRYAAEDNYATASAILRKELDKTTSGSKERARVLMWLGITGTHQAMDYDAAAGWYGIATTASMYLREAIRIDPEVFKAADVARALGQLVGSGWAPETPEGEIEQSVKRAEKEKSAVDYFYAGVIMQKVTERSWEFADTSEDDNKTLFYLARSLRLDPGRYETWPYYFNALTRLQMYDLITTDGDKMFTHFKGLRMPVYGDQGPAALYMKTRGPIPPPYIEMFLNEFKKEVPEDPYPVFTLAQVAMSTTPTLAIERFTQFIADVESGKIRLLPRENGYRVSAYYKLAYLYLQRNELEKALETYNKVRAISPVYAETYFNIAETYQKLADRETTGTKKLELIEKAVAAAVRQQDIDYRSGAAAKADGYRRTLSRELRRIKTELGLMKRPGETTEPQPSRPVRVEF